jgi:hypothetical protein
MVGEELKIKLFRPGARGAIGSILYYILLADRFALKLLIPAILIMEIWVADGLGF